MAKTPDMESGQALLGFLVLGHQPGHHLLGGREIPDEGHPVPGGIHFLPGLAPTLAEALQGFPEEVGGHPGNLRGVLYVLMSGPQKGVLVRQGSLGLQGGDEAGADIGTIPQGQGGEELPSRGDAPVTVREYQKKRRRERIFQAAMALFRQQGFRETTATDIAKAAHVSRGTFFNYYPYKEAVLLEYGSLLLADLREEVRRRLAQKEDPMALLRFLFQRLAAFTQAEKDLLLPLLYELLNPDPVRAKAAFLALPLGDLIAEVLKPLREKGVVRQDLSLERMGRTLADLYFLAALRWAAYTPNRDFGEEVEKSLSLALEGILARSQPAQVSRKSAKAKA